jgi:Tol biopolymer transport system component
MQYRFLASLFVLLPCLLASPAVAHPEDVEPAAQQLTQAPAAAETALIKNARQLVFGGKRSGEGYFSADGTRMIFQSEREPNNPFYQMYVLDFEAGETQRVSPGVGKTTCGWIHPNGQTLMYSSTHADPASVQLQRDEIAFRASGQTRRYSWDYDPQYEIYVADAQGKNPVNITQTMGYDAEGAYSPDGKRIVFASNREAYQRKLTPEEQTVFERDKAYFMDIYTMNADGSDVRRLTTTPGYDGGPFYSADGKKIVWRRFSEGGETAEIFTMNVDGSDQKQITRMGVLSWAPFFHPSGDYVIFGSNRQGFQNFELYIVDSHGQKEPVRVTYTEGFDSLPTFSPDGTQLSWTSNRTTDHSSHIFLGDWDDAEARRLLGLPRVKGSTPEVAHISAFQVPTHPEIHADDLRRHVTYLASPELEGRLTGSAGERKATTYLASEFQRMGLLPAGDKSYIQAFAFQAGASVDATSKLGSLRLDQDWRPLAFSGTGTIPSSEVVFAGYGIVAPEGEGHPAYDAYVHLDVKDKWVLVFRYVPEGITDAHRQYLSRYATLRYKAMVARDRGARGLIVVSGPQSKVREQLVPFSFDASAGGTTLAAVSVTDQVALDWLQKSGKDLAALQSQLDRGQWLQGFPLGFKLDAQIALRQERREGLNVIAKLPASPTAKTSGAVMVGAHGDHLGYGRDGNSLATGQEVGNVHYGADDNASGVAGVLEIAEYLSSLQKQGKFTPQQDVYFAIWSGEELGLLGSSHYVAQFPGKTLSDKLFAYLNMDMVGRLDKSLVLQGVGSSSVWAPLLEGQNAVLGLPLVLQSTSYLPTDATTFYLKGVPILSAFTGAHSDYHTPRDTADKLNYAGTQRVVTLMARLTRALALREQKPDYVAEEKPKEQAGRGLRVYLGTIPDYATGDIKGMRLSGVTKGGPAEAAGLQAGDIITALGGRKIENIYDYTYALDALKIGVSTEVEVMRAGKALRLQVTPGSRE